MEKEPKLFNASIHFFNENKRIIGRGLIGAICILMAVWFIRHEEAEVREVYSVIQSAGTGYIVAGLLVTVACIFLQGVMYKFSSAHLAKISTFLR